MKLYKDEKLTEEISSELNLGRVEVGSTQNYVYWIHNDSNAFVESIKLTLDNVVDSEEVLIVSKPETLKANEKSKIELAWTPTLKLKQGLRTQLKVSGIQVYK